MERKSHKASGDPHPGSSIGAAADPQTFPCMEQVDAIMQEWKEDFLAKPQQQFLLGRGKDNLGEEYVVGAPLPDPPLKFDNLNMEKRKLWTQGSERCRGKAGLRRCERQSLYRPVLI